VIGVGLGILSASGPAGAENINDLLFEQVLLGAAGGGNLSATQINALIDQNEIVLGAEIELIGRVDLPGTFTPEAGFTADMLQNITCNGGGSVADCNTGFTVTFDFGDLDTEDWQIVKIAVKADGPTHPNGIFFIDPSAFNIANASDDIQTASISLGEWNEYCAAASTGGCSFNPAASHFLVFGSPVDELPDRVPEPGTVMLLGAGAMALGVAVRRKVRA
jgi:hypothetical protein